MADDDSPADAGTTEEPSENETGIPVEATDEAIPEDEQQQAEQDMAEELDEAIEMLEALREDDPENVGALALVVNTKNGMPREAAEAKGEEIPEGEDLPDGTTWRVLNASLDGYEDVNDVMATIAGFNSGLDDAEVPVEQPSGPLGGLFGGGI